MNDIEHCICTLLGERAADASICPSDVARALESDESTWRALMPRVREVARSLAREGVIVITQGRTIVDPDETPRGPIRLRRGPNFSSQNA